MYSPDDIFAAWNNDLVSMAADLGVPHERVRKWRHRGRKARAFRIPVRAWPALIEAMRRKGKDITTDTLLALSANRPASARRKKAGGDHGHESLR